MPQKVIYQDSNKHKYWREASKKSYQKRKKAKTIYYYRKKFDLLDSDIFNGMTEDEMLKKINEIILEEKLLRLSV